MSLQQAAQHLASKGRGPDTQLVHMSMNELKSLQDLATAHGTSLSVNPDTGLPEALRLDKLLPTIIGVGASIASGGAATPLMMGLGVGGVQALRTGSLSKGIMAGLGAYGGAGLASGFMGAGADAMANAAVAPLASGADAAATQAYATQFQAAREAALQNSPFSALSEGAKGMFNAPGRAGLMHNLGGARGLTQYGLAAMAAPMMAPPKTITQMPASDGRTINYAFDPRRVQNPQLGYGGAPTGERSYFAPVYTRLAGGGLADSTDGNTNYPMANIRQNAYGQPTQQPVSQAVISGPEDAGVNPFTGEQRFANGGVTDDSVAYPAVVVYGPDGKMYSSPQEAIAAGVTDYSMTPPEKAPVDHYAPGSRLANVSGPQTIDYVYDPKTFRFERVSRPVSPTPTGGPTSGVDTGGGGGGGGDMSSDSTAGGFGYGMGDGGVGAIGLGQALSGLGLTGLGEAIGNYGIGQLGAAESQAAADAATANSMSAVASDAAAFAAGLNAAAAAGDLAGMNAGSFGSGFAGTGGNIGDASTGGSTVGTDALGPGDNASASADAAAAADAAAGAAGAAAGADAGSGLGYGGDSGYGGDGPGAGGYYARGGGIKQRYAYGGNSHLGDYSDGGRLLRGPGDGVSDSIPAMIGRRQPARLADGEFVVPARIVSELGNGSTEAGARKLYAMMDRVQRARRKTVGKGKVAKNSRADRYLPA